METPVTPWNSTHPTPLVVDLDGTLLKTDTLVEMVAEGLFNRPLRTLWTMRAGLRGRATLKAELTRISRLEMAGLPLRSSMMEHLEQQHALGRPLHLVSAADEQTVAKIAARLGLFDQVHGSDGQTNLKGRHKLQRLQALFPDGFSYAGDSSADLAVWAGAHGIVLAGASPGVARRARALGKPIEAEMDVGRPALRVWRKALRLHQWAKNVLVFVPLLLSGGLSIEKALTCLAGFFLIGVAASGTYLINDLADLASDRQHRSKRNRPLASGDLPLAQGLLAAPLMIAFALAGAAVISPAFAVALVVYVVTTLAYSLRLKRVALADVMVLAGLYTLRLVMGTVLASATFSPWLLTFSLFFFFAMSLAKRHVEVTTTDAPRELELPGRGYRPSDAPLTLSLGIATSTASVLVIVEYMMSEAFPSGVYRFPEALWAAPILLGLWICRIWLVAHRGKLDDDPVAFALRDRLSLLMGAVLGLAFLAARLL